MTDKLQQLQLDLLIAMDAARDRVDEDSDPMMMFRHIVRLLKVYFEADASSVMLVDVKTGETELLAAVGMPQDMGLVLTADAMAFETPQPLPSSAWKYTLGLRIYIDREKTVAGGIVLARDNAAFEQDAIDLLKIAESQIDSAVVQARTMWRLAERNRELEAIYQIDRLRDDAADEDTLFTSFAKLLMGQFEGTFCQIILTHQETGQRQTRSLINDHPLSERALNQMTELTRDIQTTTIMPVPAEFGNIYLLAAPFIISGRRLGAVIVGRRREFAIRDTRLLIAMTSQMDSAIAKSRTATELAQRTHELETIYRIDKIRDEQHDFDQMLRMILIELCDVVVSELGYLVLYNTDKQEPLEIRTSGDDEILLETDYMQVIERTANEALDSEDIVTYSELEGTVTSIIAVPLILNSQVMGVFGAINSQHLYGFSEDEGRLLKAITSQLDSAVFERLERRRMRRVLSRSVDPQVLEAILQRADDSLLAGERVVLSVLFADLRGSTDWAERTEPEELVASLNTFLGMMTDVIFKHGGTLDKFVGDEVIALFGSPAHMPDHALKASQCAIEMQMVHQKICAEFEARGKELPVMGVGISTGEVIAGEFGPPIRTDYTAMGRVMNLGARLCGTAEGSQIVISENTYNDIKQQARVRELEPQPMKGIQRVVKPYELLSITE
ncbi:MAG: adenylate/guanylate cyclase domain-containing protein [Phototrophicaceae bacterium]